MASESSNDDRPATSLTDTNATDNVRQSTSNAGLPFSNEFFAKDPVTSEMRAVYLKILIPGTCLVILSIFVFFSIYWGALWDTPNQIHKLKGWVVDFDGDQIGQAVIQGLSAVSSKNLVTWEVRPSSDFPEGLVDLTNALIDEQCWAAITVNPGATSKLTAAVATVNGSYNGALAVTGYGVEARNENGYRAIIRPNIDLAMQKISQTFNVQFAKSLASNPNISSLLSNAPNIVTQPLYYTLDNLRPFDVPVASAVDFVGLIYLCILAFNVTMIGQSARDVSGLERHLTTWSLIRIRVISPAIAYFFLSCFYSLLSLAFQVPFNRKFGSSGFVIYWMVSYVGMCSLGFALEAMITILTPRFVAFFLVLWIIVNVSIAFLPIEALPGIFRYGYAAPFFNVSQAVRTIVFNTKNFVGLNFGILLAWVAISCITLPALQWFVRRRAISEWRSEQQAHGKGKNDA